MFCYVKLSSLITLWPCFIIHIPFPKALPSLLVYNWTKIKTKQAIKIKLPYPDSASPFYYIYFLRSKHPDFSQLYWVSNAFVPPFNHSNTAFFQGVFAEFNPILIITNTMSLHGSTIHGCLCCLWCCSFLYVYRNHSWAFGVIIFLNLQIPYLSSPETLLAFSSLSLFALSSIDFGVYSFFILQFVSLQFHLRLTLRVALWAYNLHCLISFSKFLPDLMPKCLICVFQYMFQRYFKFDMNILWSCCDRFGIFLATSAFIKSIIKLRFISCLSFFLCFSNYNYSWLQSNVFLLIVPSKYFLFYSSPLNS